MEIKETGMETISRAEAADAACGWEVWRQDDNGVRLRVAAFASREAAEARIAEFESHHHKQTYWIEPPADRHG